MIDIANNIIFLDWGFWDEPHPVPDSMHLTYGNIGLATIMFLGI